MGRHPKASTITEMVAHRTRRSANGCLPNTEAESKVRSLACVLIEVGRGRLTRSPAKADPAVCCQELELVLFLHKLEI